MKFLADLHLHSKFSRATSREMVPEKIGEMAEKKGLQLVGTGDFTHPIWLAQLKSELVEVQEGIYKHKNNQNSVFFILSGEISSIYSQNGRGYRIHNVILFPSFEAVENFNERLGKKSNLLSDGRPILNLPSNELVKIALDSDSRALIIPAHIWTPWFSLFGANSGFDTIKDCFKDQARYIYAYETGLSSDPPMNWRVGQLDDWALTSHGDAHSPANLMREATEFEMDNLTFSNLRQALINSSPTNLKNRLSTLPAGRQVRRVENGPWVTKTVEFYPEEGKYHYDGHRLCGVVQAPKESLKNNNLCPKCGRQLTIGVAHRVEKLADRQEGGRPERIVPFQNLVPLATVIADSLGMTKTARKVTEIYDNLVNELGSEYAVLAEQPLVDLTKVAGEEIGRGIIAARNGELEIHPGHDGMFGIVKIKPKIENKTEQKALF